MDLAVFILPVVLIAAGIMLLVKPPVKINSIYGFRTKTSSKNEHTWEYCNKMCAKIMITVGVASVIVICVTTKVTLKLFDVFEIGELVNIVAICFILLSIPVVNYCCKKKFPELFNKANE